jgi:hypothetical protein
MAETETETESDRDRQRQSARARVSERARAREGRKEESEPCFGMEWTQGLEARPPTEDDLLLYFGAGCFWHVQHEMIVAEKYVLKRDANSFTSVAGYAGGTKVFLFSRNKISFKYFPSPSPPPPHNPHTHTHTHNHHHQRWVPRTRCAMTRGKRILLCVHIVCTYACMYIHIHVYEMYTYTSIHPYIRIYMYIYVYIYIHEIHTHIHRWVPRTRCAITTKKKIRTMA